MTMRCICKSLAAKVAILSHQDLGQAIDRKKSPTVRRALDRFSASRSHIAGRHVSLVAGLHGFHLRAEFIEFGFAQARISCANS
ncbi:hypothetical protein [Pseudomonas iridis]|uniref:hypothetical protein n=1 Tax=Pseudomonas iridis TaxID=2710587 RepID=UPI0021BE0291